jgi:hypothetical protein
MVKKKVHKSKKISKMKIFEIEERLKKYKEFKSSLYYQHLQKRYNNFNL